MHKRSPWSSGTDYRLEYVCSRQHGTGYKIDLASATGNLQETKLSATSTVQLLGRLKRNSRTLLDNLKLFFLDPAHDLNSQTVTSKHSVFMIATRDTSSSTERHVMVADIGHLLTLWTQSSQQKAGKMYQDSGCDRCVAGLDVHDVWQRYLSSQGLAPVRLNKKDELFFW